MKFNTIYNIAKREICQILNEKSFYTILVFFPLVLFLTFSFIYQKGSLTELPVGVFDADNSSLSRILVRSLESSSAFSITRDIHSIDELESEMEKKSIYAAFYIPSNFEKDIKKGRRATVVVYKNATNIVVSNVVLKSASTVIKSVSAGILIRKIQSKGNSSEKSYNIANALRLDTNALYNPNYNYENYIVPGLYVFTLQLIIMLITTVRINNEFKNGGISSLLEISNGNILPIWLGKFIAHFLFSAFISVFMLGLIFNLFGIPIHGSYVSILIYLFFYNVVCISLGFMISSIVQDELLATEITIVINTPAFLLSGFTFPIWGMPSAHQIVASSMPFTNFLNGFIKVYQMNTPLKSLLFEIAVLSAFLVISVFITLLFLNKRISGLEKNTSIMCGNENYAK